MSEETKEKQKVSKAEVAFSLYTQAQEQLVQAIENNNALLAKTQQTLQQAQADKIALNAQLALIRKVNEKADEIASQKETE